LATFLLSDQREIASCSIDWMEPGRAARASLSASRAIPHQDQRRQDAVSEAG
jgi:hypothetical protein